MSILYAISIVYIAGEYCDPPFWTPIGKSCNTDFVNKNGLGLGRRYDTDSQQCGNWPDKLY